MRLLSAILCASLATLSGACAAEEGYSPIGGEENSDELCKQGTLAFTESSTVAVEFNSLGEATYEGSLDVTLFSKTEMRVDTEELIFSVPADSILNIGIESADHFDVWTAMVYSIDVRAPGKSEWQPLDILPDSENIFWYTDIEINGASSDAALSTLLLCNASPVELDVELPWHLDVANDYEVRLQAFPFEGYGDLVGSYKYAVNASIR